VKIRIVVLATINLQTIYSFLVSVVHRQFAWQGLGFRRIKRQSERLLRQLKLVNFYPHQFQTTPKSSSFETVSRIPDYLHELNPVQREAAMAGDGAVMVIAGPGSGKTRVLTYRIAYLMTREEKPVDPFNILALTFTNKAAKEMRERIETIVGGEARNLWMGTFHSIFARILRFEAEKIGYPSNFTIYDTDDSKSVVKNIVNELGLNDKIYKPASIYYRISSAKNSLITPKAYMQDASMMSEDASAGRPRFGEIYSLYAKKCFMSGAMDFDDLLLKMYELLVKHPDVLYKYQHKFRYILVDEYQDTNYAQYMIVKKLAAAFENICVVGDDAQSIYSFRGADIANILNFEKDYPDMQVFKLEQNYRSTQHIVKAANTVITKNKLQLPKEIWTENGEGEKIKVVKTLSDNDECKWVADAVFENKMRHRQHNSDFAILYRTNAQSRSFEEGLRRAGIPYKVYGGMSFYQRKEIKDLLAYLKLIVNHNDEEALRRIINYPARGIGKTTLEKATLIASENGVSLWNVLERINQFDFTARAVSPVSDFVIMLKSFAAMLPQKNAYDMAAFVAKQTGLLTELYNDKTVEGVSRYENLQELLNGIKEFSEEDVVDEGDSELPKDKSLGTYLQNIMLLTDADKDTPENRDHVKLMTIHAAKGLEFNNVFVVGLEENLFPSMLSVNSRDEIEEERRLFYVAITRAKQRLFLTYATTRYRFGSMTYNEPSRFVDELSSDNLSFIGHVAEKEEKRTPVFEHHTPPMLRKKPAAAAFNDYTPSENFAPDDVTLLQPGMEVEHLKFGFGKILNVEGAGDSRIATMFFPGIGEKRIMLKYAKVKIHNGKDVMN
jgi:DNA helicase II / ATP-dependent DNA helicase PcrA